MKLNAIVVFVYALLVIGGGFTGYVKAGSLPSLIMGLAFGLLLLGSGWLYLIEHASAFYAAVSLASILLIFFAYRYYGTMNFMPAGLMALLSLAVIIILVSKR